MVSLSESPGPSILAQQVQLLAEAVTEGWLWPSPATGLACFAYETSRIQPPGGPVHPRLETAAIPRGRLVEAPILAAGGYALAVGSAKDDAAFREAWSEGLARLASTQPFQRDRETFFYRPAELLGVCLGVANCSNLNDAHVGWLRQVLADGESQLAGADVWVFGLGAFAAQVVGITWKPQPLAALETLSVEELALLRWLEIVSPAFTDALRLKDTGLARERALLRRSMLETLVPADVARAALLDIALRSAVERFVESETARYWQVGRSAQDAVQLVVRLCSRFDLFARQLQVRREGRADETVRFRDEYDVQDALHALLRLHFDDVRAEETAPSRAGAPSRLDFLLKREEVVVEAKMTNRSLGQKKVGEQLIVDIERYRAHPDCKSLVCFVYDPAGYIHNPVGLERDLSREDPDLRVVVVVSPRRG